MNDRSAAPTPAQQQAMLNHDLNRRRFLAMLGGAGAFGAVGCSGNATLRARGSTAGGVASAVPAAGATVVEARPEPTAVGRHAASTAGRCLVVVELSGGNDGLAMFQPTDSGVLHDSRSSLLAPEEELVDAGSGFGWHPALAGLAERGLAAVVGVGSHEPDYSHFEMEQRWWQGVSDDDGRVDSGFLGRICDELDVGDPVTGLSFSGGPSPALVARKAVTVGLGDPGVSWFFQQDDPWFVELHWAYSAMALPSVDDSERFVAARSGLSDTLRFAESLGEIPQDDDSTYPWTGIGQQMRFAAEVLALDVGVRVLHVQHGGFDTHTGQEWRHRELMTELNDAAVPFVDDLERRGLLDDTLVVTTSEFGRRVPENDGGSDHGGASTMAVFGAGRRSGVHGDVPDLRRLDDGNLVATARFEDYYATIAEDWFGIAARDVLPNGATPITGLL